MDSVIINKYDLVECQLIVLKLARLIVEDYDRRYTLEELQGLYDKLLEMDSTKKKPHHKIGLIFRGVFIELLQNTLTDL